MLKCFFITRFIFCGKIGDFVTTKREIVEYYLYRNPCMDSGAYLFRSEMLLLFELFDSLQLQYVILTTVNRGKTGNR